MANTSTSFLHQTLLGTAQRYLDDLTTPTIRLGVTGLAQAGKTVFITALVRNLTGGGRLPFFAAAAEQRLHACYLEPQPDDNVPRFAYEHHISDLTANPPRWPDSTTHISELRLTIEYTSAAPLWRRLGNRRLHLDIIDYPGEWLTDLQMLDIPYAVWSDRQMRLARSPLRTGHAAAWLSHVAGLDGDGDASEDTAREAAKLYSHYIDHARRDGVSFGTLGPGRFLMPGDLAGSPMLTFAPLDISPDTDIRPRSLAALMARRYESYKRHVVEPFFQTHFSRLNRQIVLVDALSAINHGPEAVTQLTQAMENALCAFRPGSNTWLSRIRGRRIDRVVFAATKADHLAHTSHDRLEHALRLITDRARFRTQSAGSDVTIMAMAAIRATTEHTSSDAGEQLHCVAGRPLANQMIDGQVFDGTRDIVIFPGDLPPDPVATLGGHAGSLDVKFVQFAPPPLSDPLGTDLNPAPWPHIRLDRALEHLLGDYLR